MKNDEIGLGLKKLVKDTVKNELATERKKQEKLFKKNISEHIKDFDTRIEKLEYRFMRESEIVKDLLKKKQLTEDLTWKKFTEEVLIEAKKELEVAKIKKKKKNVLNSVMKKINKALEYLASD
ncbi:MAG: hypothetical protein ACMXYG_04295 [Candidatus Woesearchaeota archaeon]